MRLRAQPKPVLRLSRRVLIGGASVVAIGIVAIMALAMTPPSPKAADQAAPETAPRHTPVAADALNALPKDYTGVPKLGPPLPGDFGRPVLAQAAPEGVSSITSAAGPTGPVPVNPQDTERVQADQVRATARASQLFFQQAASRPDDPGTTTAAPAQPESIANLLGALGMPQPTQTTSEPERKAAFLDRASDRQVVSDARLSEPMSPYMLTTGSVVPAALITGLQSDIPGQVLAQVTEDIHDSVTGQFLLIPRGSRLIGQYDNAITFGQSRILLVWSRLILPNGKSLGLDKLSAADAGGYAGLQDKVDYHWAGILNAAAVSTLLGIGAQSGTPDSDGTLVRAIRDGAGDSINRAGQQIVERQLNVQTTITIRPGIPVRVILTRDLVLEPYGD